MKHRTPPFGYHVEQGAILPQPVEAELVQWIFAQYNSGSTYSELVEQLKLQPVPYDTDKLWNKNMVARILGNEKYAGSAPYPALITGEVLEQAAARRRNKYVLTERSSLHRLLRRLSGQRNISGLERPLLLLLNRLIRRPELIQVQSAAHSEEALLPLRERLSALLSCYPVDEPAAERLIREMAAARFHLLDDAPYETERLRRLFARCRPMEVLDPELLKEAVSRITMHSDGTVSLYLTNHQHFGRE